MNTADGAYRTLPELAKAGLSPNQAIGLFSDIKASITRFNVAEYVFSVNGFIRQTFYLLSLATAALRMNGYKGNQIFEILQAVAQSGTVADALKIGSTYQQLSKVIKPGMTTDQILDLLGIK